MHIQTQVLHTILSIHFPSDWRLYLVITFIVQVVGDKKGACSTQNTAF